MTVGERIKQYREAADISQYKLAKASNITSQAINQYEKGKRVPDLPSFVAICKGLNVSMDIFMQGVIM